MSGTPPSTLIHWNCRLVILSVAAVLALGMAIIGLFGCGKLLCLLYLQCLPCILAAATVFGCEPGGYRAVALLVAALSPFYTWHLNCNNSMPYFIWMTALWLAAGAWLAIETVKKIQFLASQLQITWLDKMARYTRFFLTYTYIAPMLAIIFGCIYSLWMPESTLSSCLEQTFEIFHSSPKLLIPLVWILFLLVKLYISAIIAIQRQLTTTLSTKTP